MKITSSIFLFLDFIQSDRPLFVNDIYVFGLLMIALAFVFYTSSLKSWSKFYTIFPALLMAYLLPAILTSLNIISSEESKLYTMAKNYMLPGALLLLTLGIDLKSLIKLGWKPIVMFFAGTLGVVIGGPLAILLFTYIHPDALAGDGPDAVWRGMATIAGSWIGGGANQTAMLEIFEYNQEKYGAMVLVDIVVANIWMAILLFMIGKRDSINKWLKADNSSVIELQKRVENYSASIAKIPTLKDYMLLAGICFGSVAFSHLLGESIANYLGEFKAFKDKDSAFSSLSSQFFWMVAIITVVGIILSNTKLREYEGVGASKIGSVFIYILVATIGMKMDLRQIVDNPWLILIGLVWMAIHVIILLLVAKVIRAPFFFVAVGSKANIGGAASAPVVASAFSPSLAAVGVLLAVLGYAVGTYAAMLSAILMELIKVG